MKKKASRAKVLFVKVSPEIHAVLKSEAALRRLTLGEFILAALRKSAPGAFHD